MENIGRFWFLQCSKIACKTSRSIQEHSLLEYTTSYTFKGEKMKYRKDEFRFISIRKNFFCQRKVFCRLTLNWEIWVNITKQNDNVRTTTSTCLWRSFCMVSSYFFTIFKVRKCAAETNLISFQLQKTKEENLFMQKFNYHQIQHLQK